MACRKEMNVKNILFKIFILCKIDCNKFIQPTLFLDGIQQTAENVEVADCCYVLLKICMTTTLMEHGIVQMLPLRLRQS